MTYKTIAKSRPEDLQIYARIDDDGICRLTCSENDLNFLAWVAAGNTPEEPDA